jgi:putative flippase GtrA
VITKFLWHNFFERHFFLYVLIGAITFCVDMGGFLTFIYVFKIYRPLSASMAFLLGLVCHFSLNRYINFKSFERLIHQQARTYIFVVVINLSVTVIVIEILCGFFHVPPFFAKCAAVAVNVPISFLGHKYLTFGKGTRQFVKEHIYKFKTICK